MTGKEKSMAFRAAACAVLLLAAAITQASASEEVEAPGPTGPLRGHWERSLHGAGPLALIIPGSGPTDRDGNNPLGVRASQYRLLAEALASEGVATVRIDKRGMYTSTAAAPDANAVTISDYAGDVASWVSALRARTGSGCIWLIGHSEGGLVSLAAARQPAGICGLILVAAPGRRLGDIVRAQLQASPANAPLLPQAFEVLAALEAGRSYDVKGLHPALVPLFHRGVQGFLISVLALDPAALAASYGGPLLIVQGGRDIQISQADARRLQDARAGTELLLLERMNHVLKEVDSDDRNANLLTYADPSLPLARGLAAGIARFIKDKAR